MIRTSRIAGSLAGAATLACSFSTLPGPTLAAAPPASPCTAVPAGLTLVVPQDTGYAVVRSESAEPIQLPDVTAAPSLVVRGPDGTVWTEAPGPDQTADVWRFAAAGGAPTAVATGSVDISSVGWHGGRSAAVVIDGTGALDSNVESYGAVLIDYADGEQVDVHDSRAIEFGVGSATIGTDRLVEGAWADLGEVFIYWGLDGGQLEDWYDPTDESPYNQPPLFQWPIAATDQQGDPRLSWVEGPDFDGGTNTVRGGWALVVANPADGSEALRLDLGDAGEALVHADYDGRHWIGTFGHPSDPNTTDPELVIDRVLVVDTLAAEPLVADAACAAGLSATIDRLGTPAPSTPPTTTVPPTTAASTTAAPAPPTTAGPVCPTYTENPNSYPVRLCQKGYAVRSVQVYLTRHGHAIDVDGFFGPATEQAVRDFQAAAALEVDGLVGPDTWARLIGDDFLGTDVDGNGTVDPWEVQFDDANESDQWLRYVGLVYTAPPPDFPIIDQSTGAAVPSLSWRQGWVVGTGDAPLWAVDQVIEGGMQMLWLSRSEGRDASGVPLPWTVVDAVGFVPAAGEDLSSSCTLDGVHNGAVAGIVGSPHEGGGPFSNITAAWIADISAGALTTLDPARVTCSFEGG